MKSKEMRDAVGSELLKNLERIKTSKNPYLSPSIKKSNTVISDSYHSKSPYKSNAIGSESYHSKSL